MSRFALFPIATAIMALPCAAQAQTAADDVEAQPAITITGSATLVSDYRFRGVSQTDRGMAVQGGVTVSHDGGAYASVWASNLAGWGTFGGPNLELDLAAGYKLKLDETVTLDLGAVWYMYPGGADKTDFVEPYAKLTGVVGPATLTAGVAYAPAQQALGRWYFTGQDAANGVYNAPGDKQDNLYLWADAALAIAGTPLTAKAHLGYSDGNPGLGPNATSIAPTGRYRDWSLGVDAAWRNLTLGVAWVGTDISAADSAYLRPSFSKEQDGVGAIAGSTMLVSLTAAF